MALTGRWSYPTEVWFGAGGIDKLGAACKAAAIARPLLVTDGGLASLPITAQALDILDASGLGRSLFSQVHPNPTEDNLVAGIEAFKAGGHDGVVAFGGGSGLDLGKLIALMVDQTVTVWDLEDLGAQWQRADAVDSRANHRARAFRARRRKLSSPNPAHTSSAVPSSGTGVRTTTCDCGVPPSST